MIEGDSVGYSGFVTELPATLVTGASLNEMRSLATEAIRIYLDCARNDPPTSAS
jgi:predicted RNase H-like HicB family nuclease